MVGSEAKFIEDLLKKYDRGYVPDAQTLLMALKYHFEGMDRLFRKFESQLKSNGEYRPMEGKRFGDLLVIDDEKLGFSVLDAYRDKRICFFSHKGEIDLANWILKKHGHDLRIPQPVAKSSRRTHGPAGDV